MLRKYDDSRLHNDEDDCWPFKVNIGVGIKRSYVLDVSVCLAIFSVFFALGAPLYDSELVSYSKDAYTIPYFLLHFFKSIENGDVVTWDHFRGLGQLPILELSFYNYIFEGFFAYLIYSFLGLIKIDITIYQAFWVTNLFFYILCYGVASWILGRDFLKTDNAKAALLFFSLVGFQLVPIQTHSAFHHYVPLIFAFFFRLYFNKGSFQRNLFFLAFFCVIGFPPENGNVLSYFYLLALLLLLIRFVTPLVKGGEGHLYGLRFTFVLLFILSISGPFIAVLYRLTMSEDFIPYNFSLDKAVFLAAIKKNELFYLNFSKYIEAIFERSAITQKNMYYPFWSHLLSLLFIYVLRRDKVTTVCFYFILLWIGIGFYFPFLERVFDIIFYLNPLSSLGSRHLTVSSIFIIIPILLAFARSFDLCLTEGRGRFTWLRLSVSMLYVYMMPLDFMESLGVVIVFLLYLKSCCNRGFMKEKSILAVLFILSVVGVMVNFSSKSILFAHDEKRLWEAPYYSHIGFPENLSPHFTLRFTDKFSYKLDGSNPLLKKLVYPEFLSHFLVSNPYHEGYLYWNTRNTWRSSLEPYLKSKGHMRLFWANTVVTEKSYQKRLNYSRQKKANVAYIDTRLKNNLEKVSFENKSKTCSLKEEVVLMSNLLGHEIFGNLNVFEFKLSEEFPRYYTSNPLSREIDEMQLNVDGDRYDPFYRKGLRSGSFKLFYDSFSRIKVVTNSSKLLNSDIVLTYSNCQENMGVKIDELKPEYANYRLSREKDGFLVLHNWYSDDYQIFLNGKSIPYYNVNIGFVGIFVPEGEHQLTVKTEDSMVKSLIKMGAIVRTFFLLYILLAFIRGRMRA